MHLQVLRGVGAGVGQEQPRVDLNGAVGFVVTPAIDNKASKQDHSNNRGGYILANPSLILKISSKYLSIAEEKKTMYEQNILPCLITIYIQYNCEREGGLD